MTGNGQALFGMLDIDALNIIKIIINLIGTEHGGGNDNCYTNKATSQSADMIQETDSIEKTTDTHTASQNLTIQISQWSIINYLIQ